MKKQLKRLVVLAVAMTMLASSVLGVSAAGLRDVFDAKHYADTYKDLKAAFGDNEELLYQHFINYGLKEKRQMSPIIDLQAYRAAYPDLEAAFGDNWDAYVEHFFMFGAKENRTKGVLFNPLKYAAAYPDVAAAFGSDLKAITKHFLTFGIKEGRTAGVVVKAPAAASSGGSGGGEGSGSPAASDPPGFNGVDDVADAAPTITPVDVAMTVADATSASVTDGKAIVTIVADKADDIAGVLTGKTAGENQFLNLVINAQTAEDASEVEMEIPAAVYNALKGAQTDTPVAITVQSKAGSFTIPLKALEMAGATDADGEDITLNAKLLEASDITDVTMTGTGTIEDADGNIVDQANAVFVSITLSDSSGEVDIETGTLVKTTGLIQATVKAGKLTGRVNVYYVDGDADKLVLVGATEVDRNGNVTFETDHLTQFVITARKHTDLAAEDHTKEMFNGTKCDFCDVTLADLQAACPNKDSAHTTTGATGSTQCTICNIDLVHVHNGSTTYDNDDTDHWYVCDLDDGGIVPESTEQHTYNQDSDTKCVCGAVDPDHTHTYDQSSNTKCVCGEIDPEHTHNFGDELSTACACGQAAPTHTAGGGEASTADGKHYKNCSVPNCPVEAHKTEVTPCPDAANNDSSWTCTVCNATGTKTT